MEKDSPNGRNRMEAAFDGRKLDRVPVFLLMGGHCAEKAGYTIEQFLTDPEAALQTVKASCEELDFDTLFVPFNPFMPDAQEAMRKVMGRVPSIKRPDIKERLYKWHIREPREDRLFATHLDLCRTMNEMFPTYHIETLVAGPWSFALALRGTEEAMIDIFEDKGFLHDLMKYTTETTIVRSLAVLNEGATPFIGDPSAGMSLISPAVYREFVFPYHRRIVDAIHEQGGHVVFHICGYVDPIMEDLVSLGMDGMSIDAPSSLEKMFATGGGRLLIIGNIDPLLFVHGTFEQLEEKINTCMEISRGDPRYAIAPGCQVPLAAPLANLKHFIEYCHAFESP